MKRAYEEGCTFAIGRSVTSGLDNQVVWSGDMPHKTSLHGGPFRFPDAGYLDAANAALDRIGTPDADACLQFLSFNLGSGVGYQLQQPMLAAPPSTLDETIRYVEPRTLLKDDVQADVTKTLRPLTASPLLTNGNNDGSGDRSGEGKECAISLDDLTALPAVELRRASIASTRRASTTAPCRLRPDAPFAGCR